MVTQTVNIETVLQTFPYLADKEVKANSQVRDIINLIEPEHALRLLKIYPELEDFEAYKHTVALIAVTYAEVTATQLILSHYQSNYNHNYFALLKKYLTCKHCDTIFNYIDDLKEIIDEGAYSGYRLLSLKLSYTALQIIKGDLTTYNIEDLVLECNLPRIGFKVSPTRLISPRHNKLAKGNIIDIKNLSCAFHDNLKHQLEYKNFIAA